MKPYFSKAELAASEERALPKCGAIKVYSTSGTVTLRIGGSDAVPVSAGDIFQLPFPLTFDKVTVITAAASAAVIIYGMGQLGGGSSSTSSDIAAISGSPEGVTTASPGALRYDSTNGVLYVKDNGTGNTGWVAIAP